METEWQNDLFKTRPKFKVALDRFRPRSRVDASILVRAKATYYPQMATVYVPSKPYLVLLPGMVANKKLDRKKRKKKQSEDDLERSIRRAKKAIGDYIKCNRFELFCTFTFKDDRQDIDKCRAKMAGWLKRQRVRQGKFSYLIVAEQHKDGALHFHALFKDFTGKLVPAINPHTGKPILRKGKPVYNLTGYTLGHTTVQKISDTAGDHARVAAYIKKYITKNMPLFFGKNRYWCSQKLVAKKVENNPSDWYLKRKPDKVYRHPNGITYLFLSPSVIPEKYRFELYQVQTLPGILGDA